MLLGWRPGEFWAATPAELAAVLGAMAGEGAEGVSGAELRRLAEMFPDEDRPSPNPSRKREGRDDG